MHVSLRLGEAPSIDHAPGTRRAVKSTGADPLAGGAQESFICPWSCTAFYFCRVAIASIGSLPYEALTIPARVVGVRPVVKGALAAGDSHE